MEYTIAIFFCISIFYVQLVFCQMNQTRTGEAEIIKSQIVSSSFSILDLPLNHLNEECIESIIEIQQGVIGKKKWALEFLDALPGVSGFVHIDECLDVSPSDIKTPFYGKLCVGFVNISAVTGYRLHAKMWNVKKPKKAFLESKQNYTFPIVLCLPNTCAIKNIEEIMTNFMNINISFDESSCISQRDHQELSPVDIGIISLFAIWIFTMVISTAYDCLTINKKALRNELLLAFSVYKNLNILFDKSVTDKRLYFLHGVRTLSAAGVVLGHRFVQLSLTPVFNQKDYQDWLRGTESMEFLGAMLVVDTFLTISGALYAFQSLRKMSQGKSIKIWESFIRRFFRITVPFAAIILFYISIFKFTVPPSYWDIALMNPEIECKQNWWSLLLYIQNFVGPSLYCLGQAWYLHIDMQFFLIAPFITILLHRYPARMFYAITAASLLATIVSFYFCWTHKIRGGSLNLVHSEEERYVYFFSYYVQPLSRITQYFIGILLGAIMYHTEPKFNKMTGILLWTVSLVFMGTTFLGFHDITTQMTPYEQVSYSSYNAFLRPVWSLGLSLLIYLCFNGYGGFISKILTIPHYVVLAKITYGVFLTHLCVQIIAFTSQKYLFYFDLFDLHRIMLADVCLAFFSGLVWTIMFESPTVNLLNYYFK